jgi:CHAD domain-containing protein
MGYRLKDSESFAKGIKRIVLEQIDKALVNLRPNVRNKDRAIHDARVCIKKIRAVLRLIRDPMAEKLFEKEDTYYRDVGRKLSKVRDSAAMLEIIDKLIEHFSDQLSPDAFASIKTPLRQTKAGRKQDRKRSVAEAAKSLREARKRVKEWPDPGARQALAGGLKRVFKDGRTNFATAYDQPAIETFHEWRKEVKHLVYQTRVLRPLWGNMMEALTGELKTLGQYLSDDHDLAILREKISEQLDDSEERTDIEALIALIDQRRNELQLTAKVLGTRIYAEKPRVFAARSQTYWQAWRTEVKDNPIVLG